MPNKPKRGGKGSESATSSSSLTEKRRREDSIDEMSLDDDDLVGDDDGGGGASINTNSKMRIVSGDPDAYAAMPNLCSSQYCIKIGLTLYKVQHSIYLLDFQKINGDGFTFMTLCANIITELKTLSAANKLQQQQAQQAAMLAMQQQQQQQQGK